MASGNSRTCIFVFIEKSLLMAETHLRLSSETPDQWLVRVQSAQRSKKSPEALSQTMQSIERKALLKKGASQAKRLQTVQFYSKSAMCSAVSSMRAPETRSRELVISSNFSPEMTTAALTTLQRVGEVEDEVEAEAVIEAAR